MGWNLDGGQGLLAITILSLGHRAVAVIVGMGLRLLIAWVIFLWSVALIGPQR